MKPKVIFFTESMSIMGGMERVIEFLTTSLETDFDLSILTMDDNKNNDFNIVCPIETLGISIKPTSYWNKLKRYCATILKLRKYLSQTKDIQYFIANSPALCGSTILTKILFNPTPNIKFIAFEHNKFSFPGKFWKVIRKYTYRQYYKVIALTSDAHKQYQLIKCNSVHIPNALSIDIQGENEISIKKFVAVGRLVYQKGFDLLLKAWSQVIKEHPDWSLEIVGEGEDYPALLNLAKNLKLNDSVTFSGKSNSVQQKYMSSSAFILSSRYEGFGLVLIEAMAHGLPCISFNCESGPNEIISDGKNGFLVKPLDVKDLAAKIKLYINLTQEKKQHLSTQAKNNTEKYLPEKIIKKWKEEVFND